MLLACGGTACSIYRRWRLRQEEKRAHSNRRLVVDVEGRRRYKTHMSTLVVASGGYLPTSVNGRQSIQCKYVPTAREP